LKLTHQIKYSYTIRFFSRCWLTALVFSIANGNLLAFNKNIFWLDIHLSFDYECSTIGKSKNNMQSMEFFSRKKDTFRKWSLDTYKYTLGLHLYQTISNIDFNRKKLNNSPFLKMWLNNVIFALYWVISHVKARGSHRF